MGYSKRQFVEAAFEEVGLAAYAFDIQPQQLESALRRLDAMMAAKQAYNTLLSRAAMPVEQQFPGTLPAGAGNKPWRIYDDPFLPAPVDPITVGTDGPLAFN